MGNVRHFLSVTDLAPSEVREVIARGRALKAGEPSQALAGKSIAILFEKPSLRTKLSFEVGIHRLGGHPVYFSPEEVGLGKREPVQDVARVMSRMADAAIIRTFDHGILEQFSEAATIPVINALTDGEHPCQTLADLQTIEESKGSLDGVRVAYIGDGNNVAISLALGMASTGGHLTIASPGGYNLPETTESDVAPLNAKSGGSLKLVSDPLDAVSDADIVYTDVWTSMGQEEDTRIRLEAFKGYQVNPALLDNAPSGVRFMHDLPAHPGEEISDGLLTDPRSIAFDQAENRLHAQAGLLHFLFSGA
ncbi:MAG TPA: ornithine carbamoyltransferase [Dehalococcoidia bacterium]|nr:ornithine carbamoyltransferase [Dehalococcoidia bacterium]